MDMKDMVPMLLAVVIIVAIGIGVVQSEYNDKTTILSTVNESFNAGATNSIVQLQHEPIVGTPTVTNTTQGVVPSGNYTIIAGDGAINVSGATFANQPLNISYSYEPAIYIEDQTTRTVFALVGLILGILAVIYIYRKME